MYYRALRADCCGISVARPPHCGGTHPRRPVHPTSSPWPREHLEVTAVERTGHVEPELLLASAWASTTAQVLLARLPVILTTFFGLQFQMELVGLVTDLS